MSFINAQSKSPTTITNIHDCTRFDQITLRVQMIRKQCLTFFLRDALILWYHHKRLKSIAYLKIQCVCLILTYVQLLQNRQRIKQKLKLPIFGKTDKIARIEKKTQSRLISLLLILSKH